MEHTLVTPTPWGPPWGAAQPREEEDSAVGAHRGCKHLAFPDQVSGATVTLGEASWADSPSAEALSALTVSSLSWVSVAVLVHPVLESCHNSPYLDKGLSVPL